MEYFITALVLAGFGYFLYKKIRAAKDRAPSDGSGGGFSRPKGDTKLK